MSTILTSCLRITILPTVVLTRTLRYSLYRVYKDRLSVCCFATDVPRKFPPSKSSFHTITGSAKTPGLARPHRVNEGVISFRPPATETMPHRSMIPASGERSVTFHFAGNEDILCWLRRLAPSSCSSLDVNVSWCG